MEKIHVINNATNKYLYMCQHYKLHAIAFIKRVTLQYILEYKGNKFNSNHFMSFCILLTMSICEN